MTARVAVEPGRGRARWWVLAGVLVMIGAGCLVVALTRAGPVAEAAPPAAPLAAPPAATPAATPRATPAPPQATRRLVARPVPPPPVHLSIPAIGVSKDLLRLGLHADRTIEVPAHRDSAYPGWFRLGPSPGQVGSAIILGHVDSMQGPAVFYELRFLKVGNLVDVRLRNGSVVHFAVRTVMTYLNSDFPSHKVYGQHGYRELNLITCGGDYDKARGGYQSNVVVYTRFVGRTPAPSVTSQS